MSMRDNPKNKSYMQNILKKPELRTKKLVPVFENLAFS